MKKWIFNTFFKEERERINELEKTVKRKDADMRELVINPKSEKSIALASIIRLEHDIERSVWFGLHQTDIE